MEKNFKILKVNYNNRLKNMLKSKKKSRIDMNG